MKFAGYRCSLCHTEYDPTQVTYTCPKDGGNLDVILDYADLRKKTVEDLVRPSEASLWRYLALLPVERAGGEGTPLRAAGWTPVYDIPLLRQRLGLPYLWLKDESRNPSASFKDRASAIVVARAREIDAEVVVTASTGNAGAALACMAAAVGQKAVIFAPHTAPPAKIAQLLIFGAQVLLVDGSYDQAFDLTVQCAQEFGWYCRNTGYNPFTAEGKKTAMLEIWEWWRNVAASVRKGRPLNVFVSVGDGNIISGLHKGLRDLEALDLLPETGIKDAPYGIRLFGVQAEGSAAVANAYFAGTETITPVNANTLADSISVDLPRDGTRAVRAVVQSGGTCVLVKDEEILSAIAEIGAAGVFAEPAGATAYAGLLKARQQGKIAPQDAVLVLNTGNGLKDVKAAMQAVHEAPVIEPRLAEVKKTLKI